MTVPDERLSVILKYKRISRMCKRIHNIQKLTDSQSHSLHSKNLQAMELTSTNITAVDAAIADPELPIEALVRIGTPKVPTNDPSPNEAASTSSITEAQYQLEKQQKQQLHRGITKLLTFLMVIVWIISSILTLLTWIGVFDITELDIYREYEATGTGCVTLGAWYEIVVALPWVSLPSLCISIYRRSEYNTAIPLCMLLLLADAFHTKLHITGLPMDVVLTVSNHLSAFTYFLYIYVERPIDYTSLGLKLFVFVLLALTIYFTLGIATYFSFSLLSLMSTAVYSDRLSIKYCICCLILVPAIIAMVYVEAVHCNDFRSFLGFDAHLFTDLFAQCIVLVGVCVVWGTVNNNKKTPK